MLCLSIPICATRVCSVWTGQHLLVITVASAECRQWKGPAGDAGGEAKEVGNFLLSSLPFETQLQWNDQAPTGTPLLVPGSNFPSPTPTRVKWLHPTCAAPQVSSLNSDHTSIINPTNTFPASTHLEYITYFLLGFRVMCWCRRTLWLS